MEVRETGIDGLVEIFPSLYHDDRGWFYEFYKQDLFHQHGIHTAFVQENQSFSKKGVIRGLHAQIAPYEQAKLVSVLQGRVLDVVVDIRPSSATFRKVYQCVLDAEKHNMLMIPEGFAHGFAALEDAIFFYKCSQPYHKDSEIGIRWNDPSLNIDWGVQNPILSDKDIALPTLDELLIKSVFSPS
jgi:dTDP-4-dehydrorhamnose 3,5-epimerase